MMEEAAQKFTTVVAGVTRNTPRLPLLSNLSGTWMTDEQVVEPSYWANHLRHTVRFGDNLATVAKRFDSAFLLEVGPGNTLCSISRQQPEAVTALPSAPSIRHPQQKVEDIAYFTRAFGTLWCHGTGVDLRALQVDAGKQRVALPSYPFERKELYIAAQTRRSTNDDPLPRSNRRFRWGRAKAQSPVEATTKPHSEETTTQEITLEALINIWKEVLGAAVIGPDDNFFDLGGHSLLAVSLVNRIQKTFGQRLPLAALLNAPTPRQNLHQLSDSCRASSSRALVPIIKQGARTPIFLFHSHGGNVLEYYRLATLLGVDRPVYAIQCHGADGGPFLPVPIEEMARMYLEEIRAVQPTGPYLFGGYCFGGILAIETALQLRAAGQETALVFMINAVTHTYPFNLRPGQSRAKRSFGRLLDRLQLEQANFAGKPMNEQLRQLRSRSSRLRDLTLVKFKELSAKFRARLHLPLGPQSFTQHLEQLAANNDASWLRYRPRPYDGRVLFFRASKQPREIQPDPMLGWTEFLTGNVTRADITGFRQTLLDDPCVQEIANTIASTLNPSDRQK
jgi:thioesterase domain-containing protein/acyl carrier protein